MKAVGIVAEYNPFHNGHAFQIEHIKRTLKPDVIIAVMSGNFLQRGEPALVDKWTRTKMALAGGVDLVIELPVVFSTQPADFFAKGAIQIFGELGVDALSFGVEKGTGPEFLQGAQWLFENEERIASEIKTASPFNQPYAKQIENAIQKLAPGFPLHLNSANNQLGFAYAKEIVRQGLTDKIELAPLKREKAAYDDRDLMKDSNIASATAIRLALQKGEEVTKYIPEASYPYLEEKADQMVTWEDYFSLLKYQIMVQSDDKLRNIYQMNEGLEHRLQDKIKEADNYQSFMQKIKTKRYTHTRLQRLLTYTLLQWSREEVADSLNAATPIRVLGFTNQGQAYLSSRKDVIGHAVISNVNRENRDLLAFDIGAGEIYRLGKDKNIPEQDFTQKPIKYIDSGRRE